MILFLYNHCKQIFFFEIEITTVEGILNRCIAGLEQDQPVRKALDPDSAEKIEAFIQVLIETKSLKKPFTIVSFYQISLLFMFNS